MAPLSVIRLSPSTPFPDSSPCLTKDAVLGKWHVVRSSLGMWRSRCNVTITYSAIPGAPASHLDDLVEYSSPSTPTKRTGIAGIDKPMPTPGATKSNPIIEEEEESTTTTTISQLQYLWRGKGWLKIASSKWQVIAYGGDDVSLNSSANGGSGGHVDGDVEWMAIYFESTLFTSAGMDVLTRKGKLSEETMEGILEKLKDCGKEVTEQLPKMFDVQIIE